MVISSDVVGTVRLLRLLRLIRSLRLLRGIRLFRSLLKCFYLCFCPERLHRSKKMKRVRSSRLHRVPTSGLHRCQAF